MLVSTLQRLQSAAVKSVSPHLAALSTVLPIGSTAASSETSAAATANTTSQPTISPGNGIQSVASASSIPQSVVPASRDLQSVSSPNNTSQPLVYSSREPQFSNATDRHPTAFDSSGHLLQHSGPSDHQAVSANRHIPQPSPLSGQQPGSAAGHIVQPSGVAGQQPMSVGGHTPHPSGVADRQPVSSGGRVMQPSGVADQQPMSVGGHTPHPSGVADRQPVSSGGRVMQPSGVADQQPMPVGGRVVHNDPTVGHGPQSSGVPDRQPVPIGLTGRMPQPDVSTSGGLNSPTSSVRHPSFSSGQRQQPVPQDSGHTNRWNPSEPPQVTRHVNNVTQQMQTGQQYSGLRPEERARLAAHESRMESRENRRVPSEHRDEQRRMDERHRGGWYNDTRFPRDSRPCDSSESRFPRDSRVSDSRGDWRHQHRPGRQWYDDEQRRDRHEYPVDERPRYEERREERRFKEHWSRDRWRR